MFLFLISTYKEFLLAWRDRLGLLFTFVLPVTFVLITTIIQNGTFELLSQKTIQLTVVDQDSTPVSKSLISFLAGDAIILDSAVPNNAAKEASGQPMAQISIPKGFSNSLLQQVNSKRNQTLTDLGLSAPNLEIETVGSDSVEILFPAILEGPYRQYIHGILSKALAGVQQKEFIKSLYFSIAQKELSAENELMLLNQPMMIKERTEGAKMAAYKPNATQHNIPAWTLFGMFFIVIPLSGNLVNEKLSGSFVRLKLLPGAFLFTLLAKQFVYLCMVMLQVLLIFSIGKWGFPLLGLPKLETPLFNPSLWLVSIMSAFTAISFSLVIGMAAKTREQANGIGASLVVVLAAIGGIFVPSFAMPESFSQIMVLSPLHWCLDAFYGVILRNGSLFETATNLLPLLAFIFVFQLFAFIGLKKENFI